MILPITTTPIRAHRHHHHHHQHYYYYPVSVQLMFGVLKLPSALPCVGPGCDVRLMLLASLRGGEDSHASGLLCVALCVCVCH